MLLPLFCLRLNIPSSSSSRRKFPHIFAINREFPIGMVITGAISLVNNQLLADS